MGQTSANHVAEIIVRLSLFRIVRHAQRKTAELLFVRGYYRSGRHVALLSSPLCSFKFKTKVNKLCQNKRSSVRSDPVYST